MRTNAFSPQTVKLLAALVVLGLAGAVSALAAAGSSSVSAPRLGSSVTVPAGNLTAVVSRAGDERNQADNSLALPLIIRAQTDWGDARGGFPVTAAENGPFHRYSQTAPWLATR